MESGMIYKNFPQVFHNVLGKGSRDGGRHKLLVMEEYGIWYNPSAKVKVDQVRFLTHRPHCMKPIMKPFYSVMIKHYKDVTISAYWVKIVESRLA